MHRSTLAAATAAVALLLVGCTDEGSDPPTATSPTTATTEPSPTDDTSTDLTVAPANETARQFIRRWVELNDQMQLTGDTTSFLHVSGHDCRSCRQLSAEVDRIYGEGGAIAVGATGVLAMHHDGEDQWTVRLDGPPVSVTDAAGATTRAFEGGPYELVMYILKVDGRWIVADYQDKS